MYQNLNQLIFLVPEVLLLLYYLPYFLKIINNNFSTYIKIHKPQGEKRKVGIPEYTDEKFESTISNYDN